MRRIVAVGYLGRPFIYERFYPVAESSLFNTIDAAIANHISNMRGRQFLTRGGQDFAAFYEYPHPEMDAEVAIILTKPKLVNVQLKIFQLVLPDTTITVDEYLVSARFAMLYTSVITQTDEAVLKYLRAGVKYDELIPPAPIGGDYAEIFEWQRIYYPEITDAELGQLVAQSPQTLANERTKLSYGKQGMRHRVHVSELEKQYTYDPKTDRVRRGRPKS